MKTFLKLSIAAAALITLCSFNASAQKFGYIHSGELIQSMPEMAEVQTKLEALGKDLDDAFELMTVEFNNKVNDYSKNVSTYTDTIRKVKEDEIQKLRERIEEFQETAPQNMREEQNKLMAPVVEKASQAIDKVGKANGFTAVFDVSTGALAYHDEATMINLLPLVKAELGIQ